MQSSTSISELLEAIEVRGTVCKVEVKLISRLFDNYEEDSLPTFKSESSSGNVDPSLPPLVKSLSIIATK